MAAPPEGVGVMISGILDFHDQRPEWALPAAIGSWSRELGPLRRSGKRGQGRCAALEANKGPGGPLVNLRVAALAPGHRNRF